MLSSNGCISGEEVQDKLCLARAGHISCHPVQAGDGEYGAGTSINNRTEDQDCPRDALELHQSQIP